MRWLLAGLIAVAACTGSPTDAPDGPPLLRIGGSEAMTRILVRQLADTYEKERADIRFEIEGGGDAAGMRKLLAGELDIAASSRPHTPAEEEQARENGYSLAAEGSRHIAGVDVVAVSVHPSNPTDSLTYDQVIGIFCTQTIDSWAFLGQEDKPIRALARDPNSGTRALFEDFFCGPRGIHPRIEVATTEDEVATSLQDDPNVITFLSMSEGLGKIVGLRADASAPAVRPSQQSIIRGQYPLYSDLYLYCAGAAEGPPKDFIEWIASPGGQEVVDEARFVPLFLRPERLDDPRPLRETIHFEQASSEPNQRSMARLQLLVAELRERAGEYRHIVLEGYTDNLEPDAVPLAQARAEAVRDLLANELPGLYFEIIPRGSTGPIAPNNTPYGRQRNRRVQIYLAAEEAADDAPPRGGG